jgi:hypothetical protein
VFSQKKNKKVFKRRKFTMNKNIIKLFAILMMCFALVTVLVACGNNNGDEVVVQDGHTPVFTVVDGYWCIDGVKTDWKAIGEDGKDGVDGDSMRCEDGKHDWDEEYIVIAEHTQDSIGLYLKVCVDCDGAEILRINHDFEAVVTDPTCTAQGYTTYTCECGLVEVKEYTEMVPHDYDSVVTDPTCTATGYTTHTCVDCGYVKVDTETAMVAHTWGEWEDSLYDDGIDLCECERPTIQVRFCDDCGVKDAKENVIPAEGHKFNTYEPTINKTDISPCEQAPLIVSYCDVCGHKECNNTIVDPEFDGVIPNHTWGEWVVVTAPTADATGLIKKVCTKCGLDYASGVETKVLPKLNKEDYKYEVVTAPTCDDTGKDSYTYVVDGQNIVINVTVAAIGHKYTDSTELTNLVAPTTTTPGSVTVGCINDNCNHTETVEIPVIGGKLTGRYIIEMGDCLDPIDTYLMPINVNGNRVFVTFEAKGDYVHDEEPASTELVELEGEGKIYLAYWCTKCEHWIIVDWRLAD